MKEGWRPVVGYEGWYEVSSDGRVRSVSRTMLHPSGVDSALKGKVLKARINKATGHVVVDLYRDGARTTWYVHALVCEAFNGPRPRPSMVARHWPDPDRANNRPENLRWTNRNERLTA